MMNPSVYTSDHVQRHNVTRVVQEFEDELKDMSGRCMNVGSGTGEITRDILMPALNRDAVMIGTDTSESMVQYANRTHDVDGILRFETLDIQTRDLPEKYVAEFDHVFSFPTLHFCSDIRQGLMNVYNMLRPGGTFLMLWMSSHDTFKILKNMAENKRFASYLYRYTTPFPDSEKPHVELKQLLRSIGFTIRHCSNREMNYVDKKSDTFLLLKICRLHHVRYKFLALAVNIGTQLNHLHNRLCTTIMPAFTFLRDMPPDRAEDFKNQFARENTKQRFIRDNEEVTVDLYEILIAYAEK